MGVEIDESRCDHQARSIEDSGPGRHLQLFTDRRNMPVFDEDVHIPGFWWNSTVGPDGRVYTAPALDAYERYLAETPAAPSSGISQPREDLLRAVGFCLIGSGSGSGSVGRIS